MTFPPVHAPLPTSLSQTAQLTVFLEEARPGGNSSTIGLIVEGTRSFSLVPGLTYRIHCRSAAGFGGLSDIWQDSEGNTIVLMDPVPVLNFTETAVYSIQQSSDTNERSLVLQSFSESSTGTYVCHTDEDGGTDAVLMIGAGECGIEILCNCVDFQPGIVPGRLHHRIGPRPAHIHDQ